MTREDTGTVNNMYLIMIIYFNGIKVIPMRCNRSMPEFLPVLEILFVTTFHGYQGARILKFWTSHLIGPNFFFLALIETLWSIIIM